MFYISIDLSDFNEFFLPIDEFDWLCDLKWVFLFGLASETCENLTPLLSLTLLSAIDIWGISWWSLKN